MTNWTYQTVDYSKAKVGDFILDGNRVDIIAGLRERSKRGNQISPEIRVTLGGWRHQFHWANDPGAGYGFDCYQDGSLPNPDAKGFNDQTNQEYFESVKALDGLIYDGIEYSEHSFNEPAVIRCVCGAEVSLDMVMTNTCNKCHRDYNISGQLLAPRSQWGWDTGESLGDILNSDWGINDPGPGHDGYDSLGEDY
jgi:hypothetical protein